MLSNKFLFHLLVISSLIFGASIFSPAQKKNADQAALAKFEKNIELGNYAAIERDLMNYLIANPRDAKGFELLGRLRLAQNRLAEAKSLYQKAVSLDSRLASAKIDLAVINFQTGNTELAFSGLNEITDDQISNDELRLKLAEVFAWIGYCQKALSNIEKLGVKIRNEGALPLRARCYLESGEKQKAGLLIPAAKRLVKQNPKISLKFAEVLSTAAMYKESADILRSIVAATAQNAEALILLAKSEIYLKNLGAAKMHLSQAAKINPNSPDLFFVQSLLASEQGNAAQALEWIEKSLAVNPESAVALSQFVIAAMRSNQPGKAVKAAERLLELKPEEPDFLYLHGAASLQNNNLQTAENSLTRFLELRPQDSLGCLALGLTFAAQADKFEKARRQLLHCVEINPNNYEAKYQLGLSYKTQGETAKAIEYLEETIKLSPNYALALRDLGAAYLQSGAEAKARIMLEKSVAINPNDADTHFQLSRLYSLTGEPDLAKKHLEIFQKLKNPNKTGM